ncbi:MAG: hypothetical protein RR585_02250, partial [Coprobacillus sp.]
KRGSALQIVLVIFVVMTFALVSSLILIRSMRGNSLKIEHIMKQKNLEVMLISYYIDQIENSVLLSESYTHEDTTIQSDVEIISTYYEILTSIEFEKCRYQLLIHIDVSNYDVLKIEYKEG